MYHVDGSFTLDRLKKDVDKIEEYLYTNKEKFDIETVYSYYQENGFVGTKLYLVDESKATKSLYVLYSSIQERAEDPHPT